MSTVFCYKFVNSVRQFFSAPHPGDRSCPKMRDNNKEPETHPVSGSINLSNSSVQIRY